MKVAMLSLLLMFTAAYGQSPSISENVVLGEEFTIKVGERATVEPGIPLPNLKIRFVRVPRDGRCPEGAACLVAGNAMIELKFKSSSRESLSVILNTDESPQEVEVPGVRIKLIKLTPHPKLGQEIDPNDYEVTLVAFRTLFLR
jgi:hypothetical protein